MVGKDHEGGKILVVAPEGVGNPGTRARKAGKIEAGRLQQGSLAVDAGLADHVVHESDVVDDLAEGSDDVAHHFSALAVGIEFPRAGETGARFALE